MSNTPDDMENISLALTSFLQRTLDDLAWIRNEIQELASVRSASGGNLGRADVEGVRESIKSCLSRTGSTMDRLGIATTRGILQDQPLWMEWWGKTARNSPERVGHILNPQRDAFYDYTARPWFTLPAESGSAAAAGPYVDFGGFNSYSYTVTISLPIRLGSATLGVAGADIVTARFEEFFHAGQTGQVPAVLVNYGGRVIASNTGSYLPGSLVTANQAASWPGAFVASGLFPASGNWRLVQPKP